MSNNLTKLAHFFKNNLALIGLSLLIFSGLYYESLVKPGIATGNDFYNFQLIFLQFLKKSLGNSQLPFWNPFIGGGLPMAMFSPIFYPFNFVYTIFTSVKLYLILFYLTHFLVAFFGVYFFTLISGRSKNASLVASVIFNLSGFFAVRTYLGHSDLIAASSWIPVCFLLIKLCFKNEKLKYLLPLAPIVSLQILTGNLQIGYYSVLASGLYFLCYLLFDKSTSRHWIEKCKQLGFFILVLFLGLGMASFSWLPTQIAAYFTTRGLPLNFDLVSAYSQPLDKIYLMIFPTPFSTTFIYEGINFVGLLPILLTLLAIWKHSTKWEVWFFAFLIFITLVVSAGNDTPVFVMLFKILPGFANMRAHVRSLILAILGLSVLSAYGYDYLFRQIRDWINKKSLPRSINITLYTIGVILIASPFVLSSLQQSFINIYLISAGILIISFALLIPKVINQKFFFGVFLLALIANFYLFDWDYLHPVNYVTPQKSDQEISQNIIGIDQNQKYKVWHDFSITTTYLPKVFNFSQFGVHESQVTGWNWLAQSYMEFKGQKNLTFADYAVSPYTFDFDKKALQLFGVKYIVSLKPDLADNDITYLKSFDISGNYGLDAATAYLYTFNNPYPLFYTQKEETLTGQLPPVATLNENVNIAIDSYQQNQVKVTVTPKDQSADNGYFVFNELYFPGWHASINGNDTPIETINYGVRGVKLPQGNAKIEFYYLPPLWNLSILISLLSGIILLVCIIKLFIWKSGEKLPTLNKTN